MWNRSYRHKTQINAARTKPTQKQNDEIANIFSKYCEVNINSGGPYNKR
jgi:hypothetical protein